MSKRAKIARSSILLVIGAGLAAYAALALNMFMITGSQILMLGSADPNSNVTARYLLTLGLLSAIFAGGAAFIIFAIRGIIRSFKK